MSSPTQGAKSIQCLHELKAFFGVGQVYRNTRYHNHKEHVYRYVVRPRKGLLEVIIPFFRQYPLRTSKQQDFEKFGRCVELVETGGHRTLAGLSPAVQLAHSTY